MVAIFFLLVLGGIVFMFLKGLNSSKPGGTNAQPAVKSNGQKTKGRVQYPDLGNSRIEEIDARRERTPSWWSMSA